MAKEVMTYYTNENGKPEGLADKIANIFWKLKAYKVHGTSPIIKTDTGEVSGGFYYIEGPKALVRFLSWVTDNPFSKGGKKVVVWTDENTNEICGISDYKRA